MNRVPISQKINETVEMCHKHGISAISLLFTGDDGLDWAIKMAKKRMETYDNKYEYELMVREFNRISPTTLSIKIWQKEIMTKSANKVY